MINERKRMLSISVTKHHDWHPIFNVTNKSGDTISWIELATTYEVNSYNDAVEVFIKLRMTFNEFYNASEQERNSADFLFSNLTNTMGYDISEVLNIDENRINNILPIDIKLTRMEKENIKCQKN